MLYKMIQVLESVEKYAVVSCVEGGWEIQEHKKWNSDRVQCKKDVMCYFEKIYLILWLWCQMRNKMVTSLEMETLLVLGHVT